MPKVLFSNRKAYYNFDVVDKLEVGIALQGWEVKSIKQGHGSFTGAYVQYLDSSFLLKNGRVARWKAAGPMPDTVETRDRILLAKKTEIVRLGELAKRPGYTLVPLEVYVTDKGLIKLELALVRGKHKFERKQVVKERDLKRQLERDMKKYI